MEKRIDEYQQHYVDIRVQRAEEPETVVVRILVGVKVFFVPLSITVVRNCAKRVGFPRGDPGFPSFFRLFSITVVR